MTKRNHKGILIRVILDTSQKKVCGNLLLKIIKLFEAESIFCYQMSEHQNSDPETEQYSTPIEAECRQTYDPSSEIQSDNKATIVENNPESIVVVGATGLTGSKFVKALSRIATEKQTIYVLSRDVLKPNRPNVIKKTLEAALWPQAISEISNIRLVFSALGARSTTFCHGDHSVTDEEFYLVNHNLNVQIARAAKDAGAHTFILTSSSKLGYFIPRLIDKKTIIRASTERDIIELKFPELIILRPGILIGIRDKHTNLSTISWTSIIHALLIISFSPLIFLNPLQLGNFFNFGTSVGKAAVIAAEEGTHSNLEYFGPYDIVKAAARYNAKVGSQIVDEVQRLSDFDDEKLANEKFEHLHRLLFGLKV